MNNNPLNIQFLQIEVLGNGGVPAEPEGDPIQDKTDDPITDRTDDPITERP